jgi:hypothetical protein
MVHDAPPLLWQAGALPTLSHRRLTKRRCRWLSKMGLLNTKYNYQHINLRKRHSEQFDTDCRLGSGQPSKLGRCANKAPHTQEAVMSDASGFRLYAEEAMRGSSNAVDEAEKRGLEELAVIWAQAALMSDRVLGSSWSPLDEIAPSRVRTWSPAGVSEVSVYAPREE